MRDQKEYFKNAILDELASYRSIKEFFPDMADVAPLRGMNKVADYLGYNMVMTSFDGKLKVVFEGEVLFNE